MMHHYTQNGFESDRHTQPPDQQRHTISTGLSHCLKLLRTGLMLFWLGCCQSTLAEDLSEAQIKAAYLYNFAKFVEWPVEVLPGNAELLLCVIGSNVLDGALEALNGRNIGTHPLRVATQSYANISLAGCHLVFIGASEQQRFLVILKTLGNAPTLSLSDIEDFAGKGGGIGLLLRDNKVLFEVNLETIRNAGLHMPSQLLNIAADVYGR